MTLIFALSALMLHPRTRVIFRAPVPRLHSMLGKTFCLWGVTYLIYLPDIFMSLNGSEGRDNAYLIAGLLILVMAVLVVVYSFAVMQYRSLIRKVRMHYSNLSEPMMHGIRMLWISSVFAIVFYLIAVVADSVFFNLINILTNVIAIGMLLYTSEHFMPLPDEDAEAASAPANASEENIIDYTDSLKRHCEDALLFCNPDLSLNDLALALGTNRTYLSHWFMQHDTTFYNYINTLRIVHAGKLLQDTDKTVSQVQYEAGFSNKTTFRKYFLDHFGCSPTEYRKHLRILSP